MSWCTCSTRQAPVWDTLLLGCVMHTVVQARGYRICKWNRSYNCLDEGVTAAIHFPVHIVLAPGTTATWVPVYNPLWTCKALLVTGSLNGNNTQNPCRRYYQLAWNKNHGQVNAIP